MGEADSAGIVGHVDGFRRGQLEGWAWRPERPQQKVVIEVLADGAPVGETVACIHRPDLGTAGIGQGSHGFALPLTVPETGAGRVRITVRAKDGPVLPGGEFDHILSDDMATRAAVREAGGLVDEVLGTARRPEPPETPPRPQHFVLYAARIGTGGGALLGLEAYSYVFVLNGYRRLLRRLGIVHVVADPEEADAIHARCLARGENCLMLAFTAPHHMPLGLRCPAVPVIAWEFAGLPRGRPGGAPREDWCFVLRQAGRALTISQFAADAIRAEMGAAFPVRAVPTPIAEENDPGPAGLAPRDVPGLQGFVWDSRAAPLAIDTPLRGPPPMPPSAAPAGLADDLWLRLALARRAAPPPALPPPALPVPVAEVAAPAVPVPPRVRRLRRTAQFAASWYREVARDLLPPPVAAGLGRAVRVARAGRAALAPPPLVAIAPPVAAAAEAPIIALAETPAPPWWDAPAAKALPPTRYAPAPDEAPFPPPTLALSREAVAPDGPVLRLEGVVFTSVLSPRDGRKNWLDIVSAFAAAFAAEPGATLVLKMIGADADHWWWDVNLLLRRLPPFQCRIVVLNGYLPDAAYAALIAASHFVVNASLAEGQCLPLVEFMAQGRPAVAPRHSAMLDYVTAENSVIVGSTPEFAAAPHDPDSELALSRHRVDWGSLRDALAEAFRIAGDEARYARMGAAARASVRACCGVDVLGPRLADFLGLDDAHVRRAGWAPAARPAAEPALAPVDEATLIAVTEQAALRAGGNA